MACILAGACDVYKIFSQRNSLSIPFRVFSHNAVFRQFDAVVKGTFKGCRFTAADLVAIFCSSTSMEKQNSAPNLQLNLHQWLQF